MDHANHNALFNLSHAGYRPPAVQSHSLEAYTVVLSVAAHVLSMLFGGGSSVAVILAITTRRNINKYSYTLVLTLFLACCCLNFIWTPLEITDLIMYHYVRTHPCKGFVAIKTSLYIFLILALSLIIVLLSIEGIVRLKNKFGRLFRKIWPMLTCLFAIVCSAGLTGAFIAMCAQHAEVLELTYAINNDDAHATYLGLLILSATLAAIMLAATAFLLIKETLYWEDGRPHFRKKKMKLNIPEFLISQSNACADNDGGFEHSQSGTPSPSTPKLLTVGDPDTASIKGEDANTISELPSPVKPMGNRLGINMAQVLGRRRHTICQISDSSTASTPADPISKAKQYNYVRKFSVDISALQAQLQNPKIFKDAPFQSDIDLTKRAAADSAKNSAPKPLLPLKPLPLKFDEKDEKGKTSEPDTALKEPGSAGLSIPPPVIMVSNEDTQSNYGDTEAPNDLHGSKESFQQHPNSNAQKPTTLAFKESQDADEPTSVPTLESAQSEPSEEESEGQKMARLTLFLCLTFVLNMAPLLITLGLLSRMNTHAYTNISTCTLAISVIQTIVYPHLIACSDDVVHRAVQKLKTRCRSLCRRSSGPESHCHVEESSSTSQV